MSGNRSWDGRSPGRGALAHLKTLLSMPRCPIGVPGPTPGGHTCGIPECK